MQKFEITLSFDDGEKWTIRRPAESPEHALSKFLRRSIVVEALLSERKCKFVVSDCFPD